MPILKPRDGQDIQQIVEAALAAGERLTIEGRGSKVALGRQREGSHVVSLADHAGVLDYQAEELVLSARAGTRLSDIEALLAQRNQMLAFEPPDLGAILGGLPDNGSIGGAIACNLAGPRRLSAGAARDHFLGFSAVNGRGERFKSGGKVMKNVTGYDLSKLIAGSRGTLAVLDEVNIKVVPAPETTATLLLPGHDDAAAVALLCRAMGSAHDVSGAAHLPKVVAARSASPSVARMSSAVTALRVEGVAPSVQVRLQALATEFAERAGFVQLDTLESRQFWRDVRDARPLWPPADESQASRELWRLSVPPASGASVVARIAQTVPGIRAQYDWSGGLIWLSLPEAADNAIAIGHAVAASGGNAVPICASAAVRAATGREPAGLATLSRRIRESFDPRQVFA